MENKKNKKLRKIRKLVNYTKREKDEILKRYIFEKYIKTKKLSKEENDFCEKIDWHPTDELPLREELIAKLKKIRKGKYHKYGSIKELIEDIEKGK